MKKLIYPLTCLTLVGSLQAASPIISSFGTLYSNDDEDEKFVRGVAYKIQAHAQYTNPEAFPVQKQGSNVKTSAIHNLTSTDPYAFEAVLSSLSFQSSKKNPDVNSQALYVSIFTGLTVDMNGNVTSLGTFIAGSTNSIATSEPIKTMTWSFNNVLLNVGSTYQFVFTTTNTPTQLNHISRQALETRSGTNLLAETSLIGGSAEAVANANNVDPVFEMTFTTVDSGLNPEPSTAMLAALGGMCLLSRRRRRA